MFGRDYVRLIYVDEPDAQTLALAHEATAQTRADDRIGVLGLDWSPAVLYYANRWGLMVVERNADVSYRLMREDDYRYLLVAEPNDGDISPLARWHWLSALGTHIYGIADSAPELPESTSSLPTTRARCLPVPCCAAGFGSLAGNRRGSPAASTAR